MKLIGLIAIILSVSALIWLSRPGDLYERVEIKEHSIVLEAKRYNYQQFIPTTPGDAGSAKGILYIYSDAGKLLRKARMPAVNFINDLEVSDNELKIKHVITYRIENGT